jgi:predicted nucleotidyltransferase
MRLSVAENKAVCHLLKGADPTGRIYLFGSRTDDAKKGGDIDLFFETSTILNLKQILTLEYLLSATCDTKVDLLVKNPGQEEQPIFMIARKGILL